MLQFDHDGKTKQFRLRLRKSNKFCFPRLQLDKQHREQWQRLRQKKVREDDSAGKADEATGLAGRVQQQEFIIDASETLQ